MRERSFCSGRITVDDAQLSYLVGTTRLGLSITNLTDKEYYEPSAYFGGGHVIPGLPRAVTATANFSF